MKKLMIAVAAVAMAAGVQAASVDWGIEGVKDPFGASVKTAPNGWQVYYIAESATETSGSETFFGREAAIAAIEAGDLSFLSYAAGNLQLDGGEAGDSSNSVFAKDTGVDGYVVVLNSDKPADATWAYVTDVETSVIDQFGSCPDFTIFDGSGSADKGAWTQVAPEPTSGLLLLIGVAGLALRRRRA